ncbi:MAG: class I SAM-dependent methyltransferase [Methanocella conradii]|nr:class I SAM-dependent methyltransferase [Methanocella conradii]MDI6896837.1 class I SAM-dependent methyltransferase [Methanocella conradii]
MDMVMPDWPQMKIHESSPGTVNSEYIGKKCRDYSYSHYFPDTACGSYRDGVRCENIERLTFENESFDLFITQDVLEHVVRPNKAFSEIARVLKPNGAHIFTAPLYKDLKESRPRIEVVGDDIRYLLEPVYHGNPINSKGSLVTWDYGLDLPKLIFESSGLYTTIFCIRDRSLGIDGEFLEVFVSRKIPIR